MNYNIEDLFKCGPIEAVVLVVFGKGLYRHHWSDRIISSQSGYELLGIALRKAAMQLGNRLRLVDPMTAEDIEVELDVDISKCMDQLKSMVVRFEIADVKAAQDAMPVAVVETAQPQGETVCTVPTTELVPEWMPEDLRQAMVALNADLVEKWYLRWASTSGGSKMCWRLESCSHALRAEIHMGRDRDTQLHIYYIGNFTHAKVEALAKILWSNPVRCGFVEDDAVVLQQFGIWVGNLVGPRRMVLSFFEIYGTKELCCVEDWQALFAEFGASWKEPEED